MPTIIPDSAPLATITPTREKTPSTPTHIPEPHIVKVIDWELVEVSSPMLCTTCGIVTTTILAPRGLSIAVVQVYIQGEQGASSQLKTDLIYPSPKEIVCSRDKDEFCGLIFGQVYAGSLTLSAEHLSGSQHRQVYLITFQDWANSDP